MVQWAPWQVLELLPIVLLMVLLVAKEMARVYGYSGSALWFRALGLSIAGLIPIVVVVFALRFVYMLGAQ
jgi:hypothetical protein